MLSLLYGPTLTTAHEHRINHTFDYTDFCGKVMSLLFNMLSWFIIAFLPRSKHLLISWLQSLFIVNLEPRKVNSVIVSTFSPSMCHKVMGQDVMMLVF